MSNIDLDETIIEEDLDVTIMDDAEEKPSKAAKKKFDKILEEPILPPEPLAKANSPSPILEATHPAMQAPEPAVAAADPPKSTVPPTASTAPLIEEDSESESSSSSDDDDEMYEGLTAEQKKLMKAKIKHMQSNFEVAMEKQKKEKLKELKTTIDFVCDTTIADDLVEFILNFAARQKMNVSERLKGDPHMFLETMMEMHNAKKITDAAEALSPNNKDGNYDADEDEKSSEEGISDGELFTVDMKTMKGKSWVKDALMRKHKHKVKRAQANVKKGEKLNGQKRVGRLLLDEALKDKSKMDGWSEARKKAFKNIKKNPQAYYYRFNKPGEKQRNGGFSEKEHKIFMKRLKEFGANQKWGIFSMSLPGRVGYQCSNYYRDLVKKGIIKDMNYFWDGKKLHFKRGVRGSKSKEEFEACRHYSFIVVKDSSGVWKNLPARHPKAPSKELLDSYQKDDPDNAPPQQARKRRTKSTAKPRRKRRATKGEKEDSDVEFDYRETDQEDDNPMRDFIDPIDGCPVQIPAISPYGHVCGYNNWTKMLRQVNGKNICPFTKKPLGRRELVKLTRANFAQYKDKIINNAGLKD